MPTTQAVTTCRVRERLRLFSALGAAVITIACSAPFVGAQALKSLQLPPPQTDGGKPLMQALKLRATSRTFAPDPLPQQTISNLLWAAWGINRPTEGKRTAPSDRKSVV